MGLGLRNLPSIQNPLSCQDRFEHVYAAQLHMTQAKEPERYIVALQPFPGENGLLMLSSAALMRHSQQFVPQTFSVDGSPNGCGYRLINRRFPKSTLDRECCAAQIRVDRKARDLDNFDG